MIIVFFLILLILLILKTHVFKNIYPNLFLKYLLISCILSLILELTVFQFRHYESLFFKNEQELTYQIGSGLNCQDNICSITEKENAYLEISNLNTQVNNLYLNLSNKDYTTINYEIVYSDEANQIPFKAGSRVYASHVNPSHYLRLNASGKINTLKIYFSSANPFIINKLVINKQVPLFINNLRLIIIIIICMTIFLINPTSKLQELKYNFKKAKYVTISLIAILFFLFSFLALFRNSDYQRTETDNQYKNLARALAQGHFNLDLKVNAKLLNLSNPYDTFYRDSKLLRNTEYYWDYAFFNGQYYSYFGPVPCLLTYLPYYLITGKNLTNYAAMSIAILLFIISAFSLINNLIKRYFKNISYIYYCFITIFFIMASGMASFMGKSDFYNLPIIYTVTLACFSLNFYLKATENSQLNKKYLTLGSFCMALIAGCRPQCLVIIIFPVLILWPYISKRELFSKKSLKETLCFLLPFIIIALLLMYYNYARFGNIFDFGANYNLTTNDMTRRGFKFDRIFLGIYYFLFSNTKIIPIFPFIEPTSITTSYIGTTIYENMYGGFFSINLICLLSLFYFKFKNIIPNELYKICKYSFFIALIIIIFDTEIAGILPRYIFDFGFLFALSTVIIILSILNKKALNKNISKILICFILISIIYNSFTFFLTRNFNNNLFYNQVYYYIYYTFMFWL